MAASSASLEAQDRSAEELAATLDAGQHVRVTAPGLWLEDVRFERAGADSLWLADQGVLIPVAYDEMESLSVRVGRTNSGALLGGISGALAGGLLAGMAASFGCQDPSECTSAERSGAAWGGVVGLAVGAVVGGWIGSSSRSWRTILP